MSQFLSALAFTLGQEGGYVDDPSDSGGETYRGVSRKNWPLWEGWPVIDNAKAWPEFPHNLASNSQLQDAVVRFYQLNFWNPLYAQIQDQGIATKIFDLGVNESRREITLITQRACNDCGQSTDEDGKFGTATLRSINATDPEILLAAIKKRANDFYDQVEAANPKDRKFDANWRRRINA